MWRREPSPASRRRDSILFWSWIVLVLGLVVAAFGAWGWE